MRERGDDAHDIGHRYDPVGTVTILVVLGVVWDSSLSIGRFSYFPKHLPRKARKPHIFPNFKKQIV